MINRLFRLIQKEFAQLRRDPRMFGIMFIGPTIQLIIIGFAATTDINNLALGVCDMDHSAESRRLVQSFTASGYFQLSRVVDKPDDLDQPIAAGDVAVGLVIPQDFAKDVQLLRSPRLQLLIDGSDATSGTVGIGYAKMVIGLFGRPYMESMQNRLNVRNIHLPALKPEIRAWFNPELKSRIYMVPAGAGLVLLLVMVMLTAMSLVKEREIGTMEQLIVTPIRGWELLLGKILPFVVVGVIAETVVYSVAVFVFDIPLRGHILTLYIMSFGFFFSTLGLGILVSTFCKTQQQAMLMATFFVMLPFVYLSGFIFPLENMPVPIQKVTYLIPLRYFLVIARGIFLKGIGWAELWDEFMWMNVIGVIIFLGAMARFQKKLE